MTVTTKPTEILACPSWCDREHVAGFCSDEGYGFHQLIVGETATEVPDSCWSHGGTLVVLVEQFASPSEDRPATVTIHSRNGERTCGLLELDPAEAVKLRDALTAAIATLGATA